MTNWSKNPLIYEINSVVLLHELSTQSGQTAHVDDIPDQYWENLAKIGFDAVWMMGVWDRSPESIRISTDHLGLQKEFLNALPDFSISDNIGSAYAIRNYRVSPRIGGADSLTRLRDRLHYHGLKLILDFVPNHVARDHPWVEERPDYFIHGSAVDLLRTSREFFEINQHVIACGRDPFFPPWQDTAQLNIFDSGTRLALANVVDQLASLCDGIRCDMAMLCLNRVFARTWENRVGEIPEQEFWKDIITATRLQHPGFVFLAEAYWDTEQELINLGFDACYDKILYDRLREGTANEIINRLSSDKPDPSNLVHFIENHDELRSRMAFPPRKEVAAAITIATTPGWRMVHEGQMDGRKIRIPVFLSRRPAEPSDPERQVFYKTLLRVAASPLCRIGEWKICSRLGWEDNQSFHNLVAWSWHTRDETLIVVINYSEQTSQSMILIPWRDMEGYQWKMIDLLKATSYLRDGGELVNHGLFVDLPAWDFHLFWCSTRQSIPYAG
jgi:hypothetical protein